MQSCKGIRVSHHKLAARSLRLESPLYIRSSKLPPVILQQHIQKPLQRPL
ncbi:hypothetical protein HBI24_012650 [Parastagonospora nodorum]|nr:hypothetical protein HBH47_066980 [Parastagonospora nodorum]KAH4166259.1 hypothetical protein HBH43_138770 [Parastagonospora nodorum]KAH4188637.1 hypothetical protein HBH42_148520 [Parastagonospora nodorum]KAH4823328.1 hypothetical protein HBH61_001090 [Parastagonospora nodorum]KAH4995892.1 hypothetical protein HBI76_000450 [Parastagonospora nodorum]